MRISTNDKYVIETSRIGLIKFARAMNPAYSLKEAKDATDAYLAHELMPEIRSAITALASTISKNPLMRSDAIRAIKSAFPEIC